MRKIDKIKIGDTEELVKSIGINDIELYARISGDFNPIHINEEYAKTTVFKGRIAHGMLVGSFISTIIGTKLPGEGSIYLSQNLKFLKAVKVGDIITVKVCVKNIDVESDRVKLETWITNQNNEKVIEGEAEVLIK